MANITKKVINSPETCVDENLRGLVATYPALQLHPKHRVVTVKSDFASSRVGIVGGGGSGHEPFAAGFVGVGSLHAAVAGEVFASPPATNVLYAIAHAYKYNEGGVLVIIGNYTGDRLNLGKAIEKAKMLGMNVEGLIVGEDVASSHNKTGGRSMVGEVIFYKLCGAMATKGFDLTRIRSVAVEANKRMATLGVCLQPCSLPGQAPLFTIENDEMELGAGVHGEAGITKMKLTNAKQTVTMILDKTVGHLKLVAGDRVAVMIDNLGSTSVMEMNIISHETKLYMDSKNIKIERMYSGSIKTSLEMHGFQICLLHLNEEFGCLWLECLDLETDAPAWTGGKSSIGEGRCQDDDTLITTSGEQLPRGPALSTNEQQVFQESLKAATEMVVTIEELLNRLDSGCGDGDCGNTMRKFANGIAGLLESSQVEFPARVLFSLSEAAETHMGGTSGAVYSLGLSAAAQAFSRARISDRHTWLAALEAAMESISKYGGAEPGDRTMLDTLHEVSKEFKEHITSDMMILLNKIAEAAERGARSTAGMTARLQAHIQRFQRYTILQNVTLAGNAISRKPEDAHILFLAHILASIAGRASYVSRSYVRHEDAGARAAAAWITAAVRTVARLHS